MSSNEKKSILWYQPADVNAQDVIVYNGEMINDEKDRLAYFGELKKVADKVVRKKQPWSGKVEGFYFVKGTFEEKDIKERKLSFMFISNDVNELQSVVSNLNLHIDKETNECIQNVRNIKYIKIGFITIVILVVVIASIIFAKYGK